MGVRSGVLDQGFGRTAANRCGETDLTAVIACANMPSSVSGLWFRWKPGLIRAGGGANDGR